MSLTLRQYLDLYQKKHQKTRSTPSYETKQLIPLAGNDCGTEKLFQQKITNIKRLLRTSIEDFQIYLQVQKELQELKTIFYKNKNVSLFKSKSSIGGDVALYKSSRSIKNKNRKKSTNTDSQSKGIPSFPIIQCKENTFYDLKGAAEQKYNSQKTIGLSIGIQDSYEIQQRNKNNTCINRNYKNRIKTEPTQEVQKQMQNRYSINTKYNNFQIKEVDSKANSQIKIQLPEQEFSSGFKSPSKKLNLKQSQNQSCSIRNINLMSPRETQASSKVSFGNKDKKVKDNQGPKIKINGKDRNQFNQRVQSKKNQKNNLAFLPPTLETKQSKYYSESEDQITSIRRTDFSKCSYAESNTFYFKKL